MADEPITIVNASPACLEEILALLAAVKLPHEGVKEHLHEFLVGRTGDGRIVGCICLEHYGGLGLLRSAAVLPDYQGQRIGVRLTQALLDRAAQEGITEIALLTTTAQSYFQTLCGFEAARRADYEDRLANSEEWNLPRCSTAVFMTLRIEAREEQ